MSAETTYHVTLNFARNFEFVAHFDTLPESMPILLDEPPPLGEGRGPNAASLLGAAVANCLAASLLFCLQKARIKVDGITAKAAIRIVRNEQGRFRIAGVDVNLSTVAPDADAARFLRCEQLFEDFCIVTQSVREGIPIQVKVNEPTEVSA